MVLVTLLRNMFYKLNLKWHNPYLADYTIKVLRMCSMNVNWLIKYSFENQHTRISKTFILAQIISLVRNRYPPIDCTIKKLHSL